MTLDYPKNVLKWFRFFCDRGIHATTSIMTLLKHLNKKPRGSKKDKAKLSTFEMVMNSELDQLLLTKYKYA